MENTKNYGVTRSIWMVLLLSLITFGIYSFYWIYQVTKELNNYTGDQRINPTLVIVLSIITCGLYMFYWWYQINQLMMEAQQQTGYKVVSDNKVLFILFTLFGISFINMVILQSDLNTLWQRVANLEGEVIVTREHSSDDEWTDY